MLENFKIWFSCSGWDCSVHLLYVYLGDWKLQNFQKEQYEWLQKRVHIQKREIIESSGGLRHLSTIPVKNFHLFKIAKSVINFYLKKISN